MVKYFIKGELGSNVPYTIDELKSKNLHAETLVRETGSEQWVNVNDVLNADQTSYLETTTINQFGDNVFANSNQWWYIIGIAIFGLLGSTADRFIYDIMKESRIRDFYVRDNFNLILYIIIPIIFYVLSKIFLIIFIYKKWKFVGEINAAAQYDGQTVMAKYVKPIFYYIGIAVLFTLLASVSKNQISSLLILRGILLLAMSIYFIIWNYRLFVLFPKNFNPIPLSFNNHTFTLPQNFGLFLWILQLIANVFITSTYFIKDSFSMDNGNRTEYYLQRLFYTLGHYGFMFFYFFLAIYIYVIISNAKALNANKIEE
jgi:hypothetical protein